MFRLETRVLCREPRRTASCMVTAAEIVAYRRAEALWDLDGRLHDSLDRGRGVIPLAPIAPSWAPSWVRDPQAVADHVETAALRRDGRLFREDLLTLDDRLPRSVYDVVILDTVEPYVEAGEVVIPTIHLYGAPVLAESVEGQRLYTEVERRHMSIVGQADTPDEPHLQRWTDADGRTWLRRYAPHAHLLRTTRHLLPKGFGREDRSRNAASVLREARAHACAVQNWALVAYGRVADGDLDHRAAPATERLAPAAPYLPRAIFQAVRAGLPPDPRHDGREDLVAARAAADIAREAARVAARLTRRDDDLAALAEENGEVIVEPPSGSARMVLQTDPAIAFGRSGKNVRLVATSPGEVVFRGPDGGELSIQSDRLIVRRPSHWASWAAAWRAYREGWKSSLTRGAMPFREEIAEWLHRAGSRDEDLGLRAIAAARVERVRKAEEKRKEEAIARAEAAAAARIVRQAEQLRLAKEQQQKAATKRRGDEAPVRPSRAIPATPTVTAAPRVPQPPAATPQPPAVRPQALPAAPMPLVSPAAASAMPPEPASPPPTPLKRRRPDPQGR